MKKKVASEIFFHYFCAVEILITLTLYEKIPVNSDSLLDCADGFGVGAKGA